MILGPGDAFRLNGTVMIWLGYGKVLIDGERRELTNAELLDLDYDATRMHFKELSLADKARAARATVDPSDYDGCPTCGVRAGLLCRGGNRATLRRPHPKRRKL